MDQQELTSRQFGAMAARYLSSAVHSSGADLDRVAELAATLKPARALDLGCGAGHASFALARGGAGYVIAYDLSAAMLDVVSAQAAARGHTTAGKGLIETRRGPAEVLPFADASMDLIATRFSAHHWLDMTSALREVARVLRPNGTFAVIDVLAPEVPLLDTVLQTVEMLRDASHVRNYRASEWLNLLEACGFSTPVTSAWKLTMQFQTWVERIGTPAPRIAALQTVMTALSEEARRYFAVQADLSFVIDAGWFEVKRKPISLDPDRS